MNGEQWLQEAETQEMKDDVRKLCSYLCGFNWSAVAEQIPSMETTSVVIQEFVDKYTRPMDRR